MQTLTLQEAQNRLSELVDAAVNGEEVTIARHDGTIVTLCLSITVARISRRILIDLGR